MGKGSEGKDVYSLPSKLKEAVKYLQVHPKFGGPGKEDDAKLIGSAMGDQVMQTVNRRLPR